MTIQWYEGLRLNMPIIDKQHEEIFDYFDKLTDAIQDGDGQGLVAELLIFLDNFSSVHFRDEEQIMIDHNYPAIEEQREQHRKFKDSIVMLSNLLDANTPMQELSFKVDSVLIKYLIIHVNKLDKALVDFIKLQPV